MLNKTIDVKDLLAKIVKLFFLLILVYLFLKMIYNILKSFSFYDLGTNFNKTYFKFWEHKFHTDFGFNPSDKLDFIIKIRTDDAYDDCVMKGRFKDDKIEKISIKGDGEKCNKLRNNNK